MIVFCSLAGLIWQNPKRQSALGSSVSVIADACPDLASLIAVPPETYLSRVADQVDCLVATAHEDTGELALNCGPSFVESLPPRGEWTQIILPEEKWGSRCGDGSDYAIQIKPAPEGEPLDRVLIPLQGGGICLFESDCRSRIGSGLFNTQDDEPLEIGVTSADSDNPFANWTKVYLPYYCFTGNCAVGPEIYRAFAPISAIPVVPTPAANAPTAKAITAAAPSRRKLRPENFLLSSAGAMREYGSYCHC